MSDEAKHLAELLEEQKKTNALLEKLNNNISDLIIMFAIDSENVMVGRANTEDRVGVDVSEENYYNLSYSYPVHYWYYDRKKAENEL